ncbi:N-acetyl-1-D-myo-inositol-2-amino-2-deoxy-alpha-D-glucopyranoside deacetylase [Nocardioides sp. Kera G14]|uniref:N-acetyl-1-D-myo-inositol-2-amino-2-deoxy-alpha- D-glucopyranoside deacetylase n=1 Tax=Nocardioides sp. Kera G14 TaxID=2884264 RepID=UPI001D125CAF|nr:N-acetyl-1-D-myo-inositol-2-amino-2-deoxy-alpha-D-glucopyranoside deacetylase [Nocardioides sp. Kera G14]UDY22846.1 N-acetyl-1-D-myo-inositol-2-amino-2-deoxy-alpha-D-glucopyranoside deacetylase [Nocardioides sp. Kera G14]
MTVPDQRLLLMHAHPDDESIGNGATMAKYVAEGRGVTLVISNAGERGEVLVPELEHLAWDRDDTLGEHRRGELEEAMKALGVTDHRFLGGFGTYSDSGMEWHPDGHAIAGSDSPDNAFSKADLTEAADKLVEIIREVRPQVLVTYDQFGGYGHPDHIQAHRVAMYASQLAGVPSYKLDLGEPWVISKIYWSAMSWSAMREGMRLMREAGHESPFGDIDLDGPPPFFAVEDDAIAAQIDGTDYFDQKIAALHAHATQIAADGPFFSMANAQGGSAFAIESYRLAVGTKGPVGPGGFEEDLFAGL